MDLTMTYTTTDVPVWGGPLRVGRWAPDADPVATVLAVHGVTASHRAWGCLADNAGDLDIVAPDLRGRGRSSDLPGPAGLRQHADDLARVLDHLGLERVVVAGHSMGGLVSVVMADRHADRVERLVLVDGGLPLHPLSGMTPEQTLEATLGPATARLRMTFPTREAYQDFWAAHPAFKDGISELMADYFDYDLVDSPDGFRSCVSAELVRDDVLSQLDPGTLTPALERLRVPAVFLRAPRGLLDQPEPLYPAAEAQEWASRLPLLDVADIDDVNHYTIVFDEAPLLRIADLLRPSTLPEENA
ncbi:MAG: alpha/beta fold hydrolase [Candidatus Nanopelagicales bacterium]